MDETELTARSREIAKEYQLEMPIMNLSYMKFYKQPVNVSMLALVAMAWGSSYLLMKIGLDGIPPFCIIALRFGIAFIAVSLFVF